MRDSPGLISFSKWCFLGLIRKGEERLSTDDKWMLHRAGFLNFWYYDEEIFQFANGKLLLRGSNGSGKSVTMQSLIPVLLDGKKSPDRLDPFGSKARKMEDYLIGEKEIVDRDERTGYLFLEYKRKRSEKYVTTGIGLQAKRGKPIKFWGFVLLDNRRIGHDLFLYKVERHDGEEQKIPLTQKELQHRIANGGYVVRTQNEYATLVNKYIFGFQSLEAFYDLIKLLIQLRSPKLSKDFKPTVIYEILQNALPPLADEDLRPLTDTIEHMDQTRQQVEQLEREYTALQKLTKHYDRYNKYVLADHAREFLRTRKKWRHFQNEWQQTRKEMQDLQEGINVLQQKMAERERQKEVYEENEKRLRNHRVWDIEKERKNLQDEQAQLKREIARKERQYDEKRERELTFRKEKERLEQKWRQKNATINDSLTNLGQMAEEAAFVGHEQNVDDYERQERNKFDFTVWKQEAARHDQKLLQIGEKLQQWMHLKKQYEDKRREYGNVTKAIDDLYREEQQWQSLFEEEKNKLEQEIYEWKKNHDFLPIEDSEMQEVSRIVHFLYEPYEYSKVQEPFFAAQRRRLRLLDEELASQKNARGVLEERIAEAQQRLSYWKALKDPEPEIHPDTKKAREALAKEGKVFVPFYAAVEFHDHVDEQTRRRLGAALTETGLLDALITEEDVALMNDRRLQANPNMLAHTLADYLRPDVDSTYGIDEETVDAVLRTIQIGEIDSGTDVITIDEKGFYQLGPIRGHAPDREGVRFIGKTSRKRYRKEQISAIQNELLGLEDEKKALEKRERELESAIAQANAVMENFPNGQEVETTFRQIKELNWSRKQQEKVRKQMDENLKTLDIQFKALKRKIDEEMADLPLQKTLDDVRKAQAAMRDYEREIARLVEEHTRCNGMASEIGHLNTLINQTAEEVDEIKGNILALGDRKERVVGHLRQIERQLKEAGVQNIRQEIQKIQHELHRMNREMSEQKSEVARKEERIRQAREKANNRKKQVDFWERLTTLWEDAWKRERKRAFFEIADEEKGPVESARAALRKYEKVLAENDRSKLSEQLTKTYLSEQVNLMEYRMREYISQLEMPQWPESEEQTEEERLYLEKWQERTARKLIEMEYQSQKVSPYFVCDTLQHEIANQHAYLEERDRELYEEIILKSVGNILRSRIQRAEHWVEEMDALMKKRDSSSGLTFSIQWRPRTAETEDELDTKELVRLLRMSAGLLKEEDLDRITRHFRSKISRAKERIAEEGDGNTLHQVLKEVLDYRQWFSFVLYYRRERENKRELTNHAFYKFSGGEKAMAMYIPLFAAAYSRYQEADASAPFIISLDEAFAGVDENNIRDLFQVVEELGFDYVMNSQGLWGDYDTVSDLSIYELVRPKNAPYVTTIRYLWNGQTKHALFTEDYDSQNANENVTVSTGR